MSASFKVNEFFVCIFFLTGDDAEEEIDMEKNPFNVMSQAEKEASYMKDPKKTLRGYFEREGISQ